MSAEHARHQRESQPASLLRLISPRDRARLRQRGNAELDFAGVDPELPESFGALRLALTGHPAINIVLGDTPQPLTSERTEQLREMHAQVWLLVHASRYNELAPLVARLIPELEEGVRADASGDLSRPRASC